MGQALIHEFPIYLDTIRKLDGYLDKLHDGRTWTIESEISTLTTYTS